MPIPRFLLCVGLSLSSPDAAHAQAPQYTPASYFTNTLPLGQGLYSIAGSKPPRNAFDVAPSHQRWSGPKEGSGVINFRRVDSASEAYSAFSMKAHVSAEFIIASAEGRVFTQAESNITKSGTYLACNIRRITGVSTFKPDIRNVVLERTLWNHRAGGTMISLDDFTQSYGDSFVNEVYLGADLKVLATLSFQSEAHQKDFEAEFNGSYLTVDAALKGASGSNDWKRLTQATVAISNHGGPPFTFTAGNLGELLEAIRRFNDGINKENSTVVGYNLASYNSLSGLESLIDGKLHPPSSREVNDEQRRLLAFSGVLLTLRKEILQQPESFEVEGNTVSRNSAIEEIDAHREALKRQTELMGKTGRISNIPSLASHASATALLSKYASLKVRRDGVTNVPFNFYASRGRPAQVARGDSEIDTDEHEWTRLQLYQSAKRNVLELELVLTEGGRKDTWDMRSNKWVTIAPDFVDEKDTKLRISGSFPIPHKAGPGEEIRFWIKPGPQPFTRDMDIDLSRKPRYQFVPSQHILKPLRNALDQNAFRNYGIRQFNATLDGPDGSDHHVVGCDGVIEVFHQSVIRGNALLTEYLRSF